MEIQVIVLNGGSSSGKSTLARCLQQMLPRPFLAFGVDTFVAALPPKLQDSEQGLRISAEGAVSVGPALPPLRDAWCMGLAAMARVGAGIILDEVWLDGAQGQQRWRRALEGLAVLWVGVRCAPAIAAAREAARGDRVLGMAALQADSVHRGVFYDVEVDTGAASPASCAATILAHPRLTLTRAGQRS